MIQNPFHSFFSLATSSFTNPADAADWLEWRYVYNGGRDFRREYLKRFSDREDSTEFERRLELTPIPTYAKKEVNRIRNSVAARLPDIIRKDGSKAWREAVSGKGKGVDRRGKGMNSFLAKTILPEMLPMRQVGVLVDAPRVAGLSAADVPRDFRPWLSAFSVEHFRALEAPVESPSDYLAVMLRVARNTYNPDTGEAQTITEFHRYWLQGGEVVHQIVNKETGEEGPVTRLGLEAIPFVIFDGGESLVKDAGSYQITALNMISADSNYAVDSNFSFLVRQRGKNVPSHLIKDDEAQLGRGKGLWYDQGLNAPQFISPPSDPMVMSLEMRKEMKNEVRENITGILVGLGEDGTEDAGLAYIGECLKTGEERVWDHWVSYESKDATRRRVPTISYPESWSLKSDEERLKEANEFVDLANKLSGQKAKKEANKEALDRLWKGKKSMQDIDSLKADIDSADYSTSDKDIILQAVKEGIVSPQTAAVALGFNDDEGEKAEEAAQRRAERARVHTQDAMRSVGNPEENADRNAVREARGQEEEQRGPGEFNQEEEDSE